MRVVRDRRAAFGGSVLCLVLLVAAGAPLVAPQQPGAPPDIGRARLVAPLSADHSGRFHVLGTDRLGRDVWSRLAYGSRVSLSVSFLAVLLSVTLGVAVGAVAGYAGGATALALLGVTDFALAVPRVVVVLLVASLWPPSAALVVLVLGCTGWMPIARLMHGEVRSLAARPFVESAAALGVSHRRLLWRHILPNALTPVIVAAALALGNTVTLEAGLSFLGLGVQPPAPSWGNMIASGRDTLVNAPWVATAPGVALVLVVVASTLLGDALRDAYSPEY